MKFLPQGTGLCRALIFFAALFFTSVVTAQTTNGLSDAEIKGQQLVQDILQEAPAENVMQTGTLKIRDSKGKTVNIPVTFWTEIANGYWISRYKAAETNQPGEIIVLDVIHRSGSSNLYKEKRHSNAQEHISIIPEDELSGDQLMAPFANSDFWIADLGLEFFHWPQQKVIKHESRRTRDCTVLESTNPNPTPGTYSRVDSWIDNESHGIVHAEAYDANNMLLKVFDPKSFKKIKGQWELKDMDIRNVQTGSKTRIEFNLDGKS